MMAQVTMNIDQTILRQAEAVLDVYGRTMEEVVSQFLENMTKTGELPVFQEKNPFTPEEEALIDEVNARIFNETEEEFFASLEEANAEFREGKGIPFEEFHAEMVAKFPYLEDCL